MKKKILICSNPLNHEGGIVNYYQIFFQKFKSDRFELTHHDFGSRMQDFYKPAKKRLLYPVVFLLDFIKFLFRLTLDRNIRIVVLNPSFIPVPLIRDGCILVAAKCLRRHVIVFYRGWKQYAVDFLMEHDGIRALYKFVYSHSDHSIFLAQRFLDDYLRIGMPGDRASVTTTMIDETQVLIAHQNDNELTEFLYLGRISKLKGFGDIIEAAERMKNDTDRFRISVVGHGDSPGILENYQQTIDQKGLSQFFRFLGRKTGQDKYQIYHESDVYIFPSWEEGCPTSVLEALASGLFVLATDVGALREIIQPDVNGWFVETQNPCDLAQKMIAACREIPVLRNKKDNIQKQALNTFSSVRVIDRFERLYEEITHGQ